MLLGVDFDNTIVCYDQVFYEVARERGLIPEEIPAYKDQVRGYLRRHGREKEWKKLQGVVYGPFIQKAPPFPGVMEFLTRCKQQGIAVRIISHKTEYARYDEAGINLRAVALDWMVAHEFFQAAGFGLSQDFVLFGATREEKIEHIRRSGCTHFVDDLKEVFLEEAFPSNVEKIFFTPNRQSAAPPGVKVMTRWEEISEYFFGDSG